MKALKNMEAIFTVAVAIACGASYASFMQPSTAKAPMWRRRAPSPWWWSAPSA